MSQDMSFLVQFCGLKNYGHGFLFDKFHAGQAHHHHPKETDSLPDSLLVVGRLENLATTEAAAVIIEFKSAITFN